MKRISKHRAVKPLNARERDDQRDAFAALKLMRREGLTASRAVEVEGTSIAKLERYVGPALRKVGKDYLAKPTDDLVRTMLVLDSTGVRPAEVRGSKDASLIGQHWNAVDEALKDHPAALKKFRGVKVSDKKLELLTDVKAIHRFQDAGELANIKEIYWHGRRR